MTWEAIETAPKDDGAEVLIYDRWFGPVVGFRGGEHWYGKGSGTRISATHWMPLPVPPAEYVARMSREEINALVGAGKLERLRTGHP